jgi:hypothetical protein
MRCVWATGKLDFFLRFSKCVVTVLSAVRSVVFLSLVCVCLRVYVVEPPDSRNGGADVRS